MNNRHDSQAGLDIVICIGVDLCVAITSLSPAHLRGWLITDLNGAADLNSPVAHLEEVE